MRIIEYRYLLYRLLFVFSLFSFTKTFAVIDITFPFNNYVSSNTSIKISWNKMSSFNNYELQVSTSSTFSSIFFSTTVSTNNATVNGLLYATYYTRVRGVESGVRTEWSPTILFKCFSPASSSLKLWLASDVGITQSGGDISAWNDQSGNGNNALQAAATSMPKLVNSEVLLNGKPAVKLDGVDDFLQFNPVSDVRSIFLVAKHTTGNQDYPGILGSTLGDFDITSGPGTAFFVDPFGVNAKIANGEIRVNTIAPANVSLMTKPVKYTLYRFITSGGVRFDHIASDRKVGGRYWAGSYAEVMMYTDTLSADNRANIEDYLSSKYAPRIAMRDTVAGTGFCSSVTLTPPNNYSNYTWSTGSTAAAIIVAPNNIYSLKTKDVFGIESIVKFNVFPYVRLSNKTVYLCQGDTFKIDLKTPAGFTAVWSTGVNNTKINLTQAGQYTVTVTDATGTCSVKDTINLVVDNPVLSPVPDVNDSLRLCLNEKIFLNTITAFDSIRWSTGSTSTFIPVTAPGNYTVYGRTTTGCVLSKSFKVKVNGEAPVAKFVNSSVCQNSPTFFTDSSTTSASSFLTTWKWTFGDGNTASITKPSNVYTNLGTYTVGFKVTTNQGCSDSTSKTIIVNKKPQPAFYNSLSCAGIPTNLVDQTIANSASVINWVWDFNGFGTSNGIQNPSFRFPAAGDYNIKLTSTNSNGCKDSITVLTTVNASPIADFSFDSVCGKTPVSLKFLATVAAPSTIPVWEWNFGDGTFESAVKEPQHQYATPGIYDVQLVVRSSNQCVDTTVQQIKVFDFPVIDFNVSQSQCTGKEIQFTDISTTPDGTPVTQWNWFFSGLSTSSEQNPRYTFNTEGNYTIQLTAKNAVGCSNTKQRSIAISAPPTPKFTFSPQNGLPPLCVTYNNQSPVNGNYLWSYGDNTGPFIAAYNPPQHCYTALGTYPITLVATDFRGCTDTLRKYILVDKAYLDGVMAAISIIPDGDFYKIQVSVINNSNIEITSLGLGLQIGGGAIIRETWTGSLLPGKTTVYLFTGEIKLSESNQIPVVCASIDNINNNAHEDRIDNNTTCKEVKVGSFDVFNIYPNPSYETINFGIMLPKDGRVNIRFVDILGQQMYSKDFDGFKGYNNLQMTTMQLNAAMYVAEISFDGEVIRQKFMKRDRK